MGRPPRSTSPPSSDPALEGRSSRLHDIAASAPADTDRGVSIDEATSRLGRDRSRVYALLRSGDLVALPSAAGAAGVRIDRSSLERWAQASAQRTTGGRLLAPRNAWALIGLAGGDATLRERCLGLIERPEELSRLRSRLAGSSLLDLAAQLRRRAAVTILQLPADAVETLSREATLVRSGASAAEAYGWHELAGGTAWVLDAYAPQALVQRLLDGLPPVALGVSTQKKRGVVLRVVDGPWPFPVHHQLAPQPLAALDLLDYSEPDARRIGREVLRSIADASPAALARRSARGRALMSPRVGKMLGAVGREPKPQVIADPHTDTSTAAAHILGVLWATNKQGATVNELRLPSG